MWSQHGPLRLMPKYCVSTRAEMAGGGTGRCVSAIPGSARFTSSRTNGGVQTLTSCGVRGHQLRLAHVGVDREHPSRAAQQRWSVISPSQK